MRDTRLTAIRLTPRTRRRLARLKASPRETYEEVLERLLALVPAKDDEGLYTQAFQAGLLQARLDIRDGRIVDHEQATRGLSRQRPPP